MIIDDALHHLAERGNKDAQYQLGVRYCMRNNRCLAHYWLTNAANQNHSIATDLLFELKKRNLFNDC